MSALRLAVLAALCACLALSARGQTDPTTQCYSPDGEASGPWQSDQGYWDILGLQSTYSSLYTVLCSFRGYYLNGPAGTNTPQYGPWHGNSSDASCGAVFTSVFASSSERGLPNAGPTATRTNAATGGKVLTSFKIGGACNTSAADFLCAGNCPGAAGYDPELDQQLDQQQAEPAYSVSAASASATSASVTSSQAAPPPQGVTVLTYLNSSQVTGLVTRMGSPYNTGTVSAITALQKCTANEVVVCSAQSVN